jgi:hypothetical protein
MNRLKEIITGKPPENKSNHQFDRVNALSKFVANSLESANVEDLKVSGIGDLNKLVDLAMMPVSFFPAFKVEVGQMLSITEAEQQKHIEEFTLDHDALSHRLQASADYVVQIHNEHTDKLGIYMTKGMISYEVIGVVIGYPDHHWYDFHIPEEKRPVISVIDVRNFLIDMFRDLANETETKS